MKTQPMPRPQPDIHEAEAERLFAAYCEAAERAQRTQAISDGIAAGRAWREFLEEFCPIPSASDFPDYGRMKG